MASGHKDKKRVGIADKEKIGKEMSRSDQKWNRKAWIRGDKETKRDDREEERKE